MTAPGSALARAEARQALVNELAGPAMRSVRISGAIASILFLALIAIAAFVPISSGTIAPGQLAPEVSRQVIKHATGGIIGEILVREGDAVTAGQVLIRLKDVQERAASNVLDAQLTALRAEEAVRQAEVIGAESVRFPDDLLTRRGEASIAGILAAQESAFAARRASIATVMKQNRDRETQITQAISGTRARIAATNAQRALIKDELDGLKTLLEKGLIPKTRVLALERTEAGLLGDVETLKSEILKLEAERSELAAQLNQIGLDAKTAAADALRAIQGEIAAASDRAFAAGDALARTTLLAPVDGAVVGLRAATIGGVIGAGEPILEIVPKTDRLIVRAQIDPRHADDVKAGQPAMVRFGSLGAGMAPRLEGVVETISADVLTDGVTGLPYFEARIILAPDAGDALPPQAFAPGLPVEVLIRSGSRSFLQSLFAPLDATMFRAMRER